MANPQVENGFIKISNEIYNALCKIRIPGEPRQLFDFIIRKTYGFNRKEAPLTLDEFCKTGIKKKAHIIRGIKKLKEMGLIIVVKKDNNSDVFYSIQKDYELWKSLPKKVTAITKYGNGVTKNGNEINVSNKTEGNYDFENQEKPEENGFSDDENPLPNMVTIVTNNGNNPLPNMVTTINNKNISLKTNIKTIGDLIPISNTNKGNRGTGKRKYLSFVYLKDEEYRKLCEMFGEHEAQRKIQNLDDYIAIKGVKYKDHYRTILVWHRKDEEKKSQEREKARVRKMREAF